MTNKYRIFLGSSATIIAFLVFTVAAFINYSMVLVICVLDRLACTPFVRLIPFEKILIPIDAFYMVVIFCCSLACAIREGELNSYQDGDVYLIFNKGAFGTSAVRPNFQNFQSFLFFIC